MNEHQYEATLQRVVSETPPGELLRDSEVRRRLQAALNIRVWGAWCKEQGIDPDAVKPPFEIVGQVYGQEMKDGLVVQIDEYRLGVTVTPTEVSVRTHQELESNLPPYLKIKSKLVYALWCWDAKDKTRRRVYVNGEDIRSGAPFGHGEESK